MNPSTIICIVIIFLTLLAMGMVTIYRGCNESIKAIEEKVRELKEEGQRLRNEWLMLKVLFEAKKAPQKSIVPQKESKS
jgi:hypothetical protein